MITPSDLPDDIEMLKAMLVAKDEAIVSKDETIVAKEDRIVQLEGLVVAFKQALFGSKSEKLDPDQFNLSFEDIETEVASICAADEADPNAPAVKEAKKRQTNRGSLPKHLPRVEEVIEPEETVYACGSDLHVIGEDVSERLDVIPAQFQVIVTRRPKYACRSCKDSVHQALAPAHLIPGGLPTEATIAHVLSRNTLTTSLCTDRARYTPVRGLIWIVRPLPIGSAGRRLNSSLCLTVCSRT